MMSEVWNESHIFWEQFQTPFFFIYKKPYMLHFQKTQKSCRKNLKFTKIVNQKGVFHKTLSSQFYLIGTFSSPNPFSLKFLISILLNCDRID